MHPRRRRRRGRFCGVSQSSAPQSSDVLDTPESRRDRCFNAAKSRRMLAQCPIQVNFTSAAFRCLFSLAVICASSSSSSCRMRSTASERTYTTSALTEVPNTDSLDSELDDRPVSRRARHLSHLLSLAVDITSHRHSSPYFFSASYSSSPDNGSRSSTTVYFPVPLLLY